MPTCPSCDAELSPTDLKEGWCDHCGKKLPGFVTSSVPTTTRPTAGRSGITMDKRYEDSWSDVTRDQPDEDYVESRNRFRRRQIASLGSRFIGFLVDGAIGVVPFIPGFVLLVVAGNTKQKELISLGLAVTVIGVLFLAILQIVLLSRDGQTLGKKFARTRIINNRDGSNPGFVGAFLMRNFVTGLIAAIPCVGFIFGIVDICYIFGEDHRRLADMIADTVVVDA